MEETIKMLIIALESSNKFLNSFYNETAPGEKKDAIQGMINANTEALIVAMENTANNDPEVIDEELIKSFFVMSMQSRAEIIGKLEEIKDSFVIDEFKLSEKVIDIIHMLHLEEDERITN